MDKNLRAFNALLNRLAALVLKAVKAEVRRKKWKAAVVEFRGPTTGGACISKLRIELADSTVLKDADVPLEASTFFMMDVWQSKKSSFPEQWFGLQLTISPDATRKADYNYDEKCFEDSAFFDS
jgi:hypothetical protein